MMHTSRSGRIISQIHNDGLDGHANTYVRQVCTSRHTHTNRKQVDIRRKGESTMQFKAVHKDTYCRIGTGRCLNSILETGWHDM